jgi:hypothetical protein
MQSAAMVVTQEEQVILQELPIQAMLVVDRTAMHLYRVAVDPAS